MAGHEDTADGPPPRPSPPRRRREGIVIEGKPAPFPAYRWRAAPEAPALRGFLAAALGGAVGAALTLAAVYGGGRVDLAPVQQPDMSGESRDLPARLDAIENTLAGAAAETAALARRMAALDAAQKAAGEAQAEAARAARDSAAAVAALQAQAATDRTRPNALPPQAEWAAAVSALRRRLDAGEPLAGELAALDRLGAPPAALASLRPFAAAGAPSLPALARTLRELAPGLAVEETPAAAEDGPIRRLLLHLQGLAKIRKVGESRDGDVAARAEDALARGDLAGALTVLNDLPPLARAAARGWIEGAQARLAADAAAQALAREAADPGGARR